MQDDNAIRIDAAANSGDSTGEPRADPEVVEKLRNQYIDLSKKSLYFFCKAVLGYSDMTVHTHWEYAKFIQDLSNRRTLDLMPRSTFKTSIGTIGFVLWLLIHNPNLFILLANQTAGNAERMLLEIEAHLDGSNPMMTWLFPEMIKPHSRFQPWSSSKMSLPNRTVVSGTPTVMTIGVGGKAESLHFHIIIKDDLIGRAAMMSRLEMQDAIAWNDYSESLFVNPATDIERIHGTRWSIDDLYSLLVKDPNYEVFIRKAVSDDGTLFFPERLDHDTLRKIRENNFLVFMSQYQNDPTSPENLDFRQEWLRHYELGYDNSRREYFCRLAGLDYYVSDMTVHMYVDPASSGDIDLRIDQALRHGRVTKANNAIVIVGAHPSGMWFILDLWTGRGVGQNPELQISEKILEFAQRWQGYVRKGWVEAFGAEGGLITVFNMLCRQRGYHFPMDKIPRGQAKAKKVRIRGSIGPVAGSGNLCVRSIFDQFILEYSQFPQSDTFDTLDAVAWAIINTPKPQSKARQAVVTEEHLRQKRMRLRHVGNAGY
jgi:hypothetical protein